jgi:hypothetical protein
MSKPSMPVMTAAEIGQARLTFERDQARAARHERTETSAVAVARALVAAYALLGAYAVLAVLGILPAAGWSVLG